MSQEVRTGQGRTLVIAAWVLVPALLLVALVVMTLRKSTNEGEQKKKERETNVQQENTLATVRSTLARQADLTTCRTVVALLNTHLQRNKQEIVPDLPDDRAARLRAALVLDQGDLDELKSKTFTPLDAHYLESCFLLRDAARTLALAPPAGRKGARPVKQSSLERASLAFAWVVREVRLALSFDPLPVPPAFALRRGSGTALERALVFLSLLEQFGLEDDQGGIQGCLLFIPDKEPWLWACGVVCADEPDRLYLFDPRLGLPIPGPAGKGVATLAQARSDPKVLSQLHADKLRYDVSAEQAGKAQVHVFAQLTALAPRMRVLQDKLLRERTWEDQPLPAPVRIKLAEDDPGAPDSVRKAVVASGGKGEAVTWWPRGSAVLRRFFPKEEGGADDPAQNKNQQLRLGRLQLHQFRAVPWENFPVQFRDPDQFRADIGLGRQLRIIYSTPFLRGLYEPGSPRDLLLRGQFAQATPELVREQELWQQARARRLEAGNQDKELEAWVNNAFAAFAALQRAQGTADEPTAQARVNLLWRWKPGEAIEVLMNGSIAEPRGAAVAYELGLVKHEQAVRLQVRLDLAERAGVPTPEDAARAREAWQQASYTWKRYQEDHPKYPQPSARRLQGEALEALGDRAGAVRLWQDTTGISDDLPKLAVLWLARQAK